MIEQQRFAVEPWAVRESGLDLAALGQTESVFALANGHIGLRGNLAEGDPHALPGSYLNSFYALRPLLSNEAIQARERLTVMERRLAGTGTAVAVSADHFFARSGIPTGGLIRSGVMDASTNSTRATVGVGAGGTLYVDRVLTTGTWKGSGQRRPLVVNQAPARRVVP